MDFSSRENGSYYNYIYNNYLQDSSSDSGGFIPPESTQEDISPLVSKLFNPSPLPPSPDERVADLYNILVDRIGSGLDFFEDRARFLGLDFLRPSDDLPTLARSIALAAMDALADYLDHRPAPGATRDTSPRPLSEWELDQVVKLAHKLVEEGSIPEDAEAVVHPGPSEGTMVIEFRCYSDQDEGL